MAIHFEAFDHSKVVDWDLFEHIMTVKAMLHLRNKFGCSWFPVFKFHLDNKIMKIVFREIIVHDFRTHE